MMAGHHRYAAFSTRRLGEKHESSFFIGKHILADNDAPEDVLMGKSADQIKLMTGGRRDLLPAETKFRADRPLLRGMMLPILTMNHHLRMRTGVDRGAWSTRIALIEADGPEYDRSGWETDFVGRLLGDAEEASGLLNLAIEGITTILRDGLGRGGVWMRSEAQRNRIDDILDNCDTVRRWVQECTKAIGGGSGVSVGEALEHYAQWCDRTKRPAWPERDFQREVKTAIIETHRKTDHGGIIRNGKSSRGWSGLVLSPIPVAEEAQPEAPAEEQSTTTTQVA